MLICPSGLQSYLIQVNEISLVDTVKNLYSVQEKLLFIRILSHLQIKQTHMSQRCRQQKMFRFIFSAVQYGILNNKDAIEECFSYYPKIYNSPLYVAPLVYNDNDYIK